MKPCVKLVNVSDNRLQAWQFSRPSFNSLSIDMEEIGGMDIGVNSLCNLTFEITSSVVFRDWLLSIRPIFCWARSSRVIAMKDATISEEFDGEGQSALDAVIAMSEDNDNDAIREGLPLSMSTSYTVSMDMRTCVGMMKTMNEVDTRMYEVYGVKFWDECRDIPGFITSKVKPFTEIYMPNEIDEEVEYLDTLGTMMVGRYAMKGALVSQFIRSSQAKVKFGLWKDILMYGYKSLGSRTQASRFDITFYMDANVYHKMMQLRSHWFADWSDDMWGTLVADYTDDMTDEEFWEFTPAGAGKRDPYREELLNRVTLDDPNLPCPIMLEMPSLIEERVRKFGDNRMIHRYETLADNGFIVSNPDNVLRGKYEDNLNKCKRPN